MNPITLTLPSYFLLVCTILIASSVYVLIRYFVHTSYSRLKNQVQTTFLTDLLPQIEPEKDSYADDLMSAFLSSIKVFGYIDRPVFHELVRSTLLLVP